MGGPKSLHHFLGDRPQRCKHASNIGFSKSCTDVSSDGPLFSNITHFIMSIKKIIKIENVYYLVEVKTKVAIFSNS